MSATQRTKGAAYERECVKYLKSKGWTAKRMAPMQTGDDEFADVEAVRAMPHGEMRLSVECKVGRQVPAFFYKALKQAEQGKGVPVVFARGHREREIVVMYREDVDRFERVFSQVGRVVRL